jgi:hypothetical protein
MQSLFNIWDIPFQQKINKKQKDRPYLLISGSKRGGFSPGRSFGKSKNQAPCPESLAKSLLLQPWRKPRPQLTNAFKGYIFC